jgi:hypothetical protein
VPHNAESTHQVELVVHNDDLKHYKKYTELAQHTHTYFDSNEDFKTHLVVNEGRSKAHSHRQSNLPVIQTKVLQDTDLSSVDNLLLVIYKEITSKIIEKKE